MSDLLPDSIKNNYPLIGVLTLVLSGQGLSFYGERSEDTEIQSRVSAVNALESELKAADIIQNYNYTDLLQKFNDQQTRIALLELRLQQLE